jgi:hypothetical protein
MRLDAAKTAFLVAISLLIPVVAPVFAACDYEPDAPDCSCFNNTGDWDPSGTYIQDLAITTLGTRESCPCPGTWDCDWEIDPNTAFTNAGKPYYQMVLGCNDPLCAMFASLALWFDSSSLHKREAWCSETISYWHREAALPYTGGYKTCGWHCDWQNYNVFSLRRWYTSEDFVNEFGYGGRGRWIEPGDVDYENFELGVTVPVPGAYVAIRGYTYGAPGHRDQWHDFKNSHSLMVNEMWVHKDILGNVFQVKVTLLEGNSDNRVRNDNFYEDIWSVTPQGPDWIGSDRKIYGFGIDLDSNRDLVYDPSRLHYVHHQGIALPPSATPVLAADLDWDKYGYYIDDLRAYAKLLFESGPPKIIASPAVVKVPDFPDGNNVHWFFDKNIFERLDIDIDLRAPHPVPIKGIELTWNGAFLPQNYSVLYAGADQEYRQAYVPDLSKIASGAQGASIPVPAFFSGARSAVEVRYVTLVFPKGTFAEDAVLEQFRFLYDQGPWEDSDDNPFGCFPEGNPAYQDWLALGAPSCWCAPPVGSGYQCDGDADGKDSGIPFNFRVFTGDLTLIVDNWKRKTADPKFDPCADIDHKDSGLPFNFRVFTGDLAILVKNWKAKDPDLPNNCPRPK